MNTDYTKMKRSDFIRATGLGAFLSMAGFAQGNGQGNAQSNGQGNGQNDAQNDTRNLMQPGEVMAVGNPSLIYPSRLTPGDTIAIVATAGIVSDEATLMNMRRSLESMGLRVRFGESVKARHGYFSGTDAERAADLHRMFLDPEVKAVMAVRGGWGTARLIPLLNFQDIRRHPKIFCGFSDNTTLHLAFLKHAGLVSFHGPNGNADWSTLTTESFRAVLLGDGGTGRRNVEFRSEGSTSAIQGGVASGPLIGGNLSILTSAIGTSYQPETNASILFAEDIGEPPYKIDRMMTHLRLAGLLDGISGFVFGTCLNCKEEESAFSLREVLEHHLKPLGVPVLMGVDIGHHARNFTLPMGWVVQMDADRGLITAELPG